MSLLPGDGWGVAGGRESPESGAVTWAGGPTITSSTGRNTRPLNRPSTSSATRTRKKYLQLERVLVQFILSCLLSSKV